MRARRLSVPPATAREVLANPSGIHDLLEEFGAHFEEAKALVERAAADGEAVLIVIR